MMKRLTALLLTVMLLLPCVAGLAESWTCPSCGANNDGNFCGNCGAKKPTGSSGGDVDLNSLLEALGAGSGGGTSTVSTSSGLQVTGVALESDGAVSVSWSGGSAPYNVSYASYMNSDHNRGAEVINWSGAANVSGSSVRLADDLVPGERYWVWVTDAGGKDAEPA